LYNFLNNLIKILTYIRSSTNPSFLKLLKNSISPIAPSVIAGQKTGILFFAAQ